MTSGTGIGAARLAGQGSFRHVAFLYSGQEQFLRETTRFIEDGLRASEPTLVMVGPAQIAALRGELGADATRVQFSDMRELGANPARIIPAWREFMSSTVGKRKRGIGEPIWPGQRPDALVEAQHHELLLNLAFTNDDSLWLLCPYDTARLPADVVAGASHSHERVGGETTNSSFCSDIANAVLGGDLSPAPGDPELLEFRGDLRHVREFVGKSADSHGLDAKHSANFVLAVNEVATNSVRHGGGGGTLRLWADADWLVCEVHDRGRVIDPMVGRVRPAHDQLGGRGLWIANQLCDLLQLRSTEDGTTVRVHQRTH